MCFAELQLQMQLLNPVPLHSSKALIKFLTQMLLLSLFHLQITELTNWSRRFVIDF